MGFLFPIAGLLLLHAFGLESTRAWYEQKLNESGSGTLKDEWDKQNIRALL